MAFTNDESSLNGINLDLITEYQDFMTQLKPILLEESGYQSVSDSRNAGFRDFQDAADKIYNQTGLLAGRTSEAGAAKQLGMSLEDFKKVRLLVDQANGQLPGQNGLNPDQGTLGQINDQLTQFQLTSSHLTKTPERLALEQRFKKLQETELQQLEEQSAYLGSDEYKQATARQKQLEKSQQENSLAFAERQRQALAGEIGTSPILQKKINDSFNQFKEAQARNGNIIMGDSLENAVGKGTAATEALGVFQDNVAALKQREVESIVNQTPLNLAQTQLSSGLFGQSSGLGATGQFSTGGFNQANATPQSPNYSGLSGMTLSGQQPFQFDRQLALQQAQIDAQNRKSGSGKSGLLGGLAGAGIGALLAAPTGGMSMLAGAQLGGYFGSGAGTLMGGGY